MTLTLDTSIGTTTANSYCDDTFADSYLAATAYAASWAALTGSGGQQSKYGFLIRATRELDVLPFPSVRTYTDQALSFPRVGIFDDSGGIYDSAKIPLCVQQAVALLAGWLSSRPSGEADPFGNDPNQNVATVKAGPVDVALRDGAPMPGNDFVKRTVWPILARGGVLPPTGRSKLVR